ncbi:MAG: DUF1802 family protein [Kastovskya adunca ATA6-11-RM4]|jgi:hypothetical protein|nr:DUF1802 family protein [Kastovskya adunca ATA6-11-RM4]
MPATTVTTTHALKEWALAIEALERGKTIMLIRKGGIREVGNRFQVAHNQVLLYPTYEHQKSDLLKVEYALTAPPVSPGWHPETVPISSWAEITDILPVSDQSVVQRLLPHHIWNEKFVSDRLHWKPNQPLFVLLLRAYLLPQAEVIPYRQDYGGCRSWIDLVDPISLEGITPVLHESDYNQRVSEIRKLIEEPG